MAKKDPACARYQLLKAHEDSGVQYAPGDILEFTCDEVAFLQAHDVIGQPTERAATRKRLSMPSCAGCGPTLVSVPAADAKADAA